MILVTGATGFIGQHLVKQLVEAQYPVCSLIRPSPRERSFAPGVKMHIVAGDLNDLPALRVALYHATHVVHLAGVWEETERDTFESANLQGTRNLIEAMKEVGVKRLDHDQFDRRAHSFGLSVHARQGADGRHRGSQRAGLHHPRIVGGVRAGR